MKSIALVFCVGTLATLGCAPPASEPNAESTAIDDDGQRQATAGIRRLVTGHDANGRAVFASDEQIEPITLALMPGAEIYSLWGADKPPRFPHDGSAQTGHDYFPPVGGFRFGVFTVAPDSMSIPENLDMEAAFNELNEKLPGVSEHLEADNSGMHRTATIDYEYVVSGRCMLELDDGVTRELGPGDTVIQNGTRHAWHNPFDEPCVMVVAIVGAHNDLIIPAGQ